MITYSCVKALRDGDGIGIFSPSEWLGGDRPDRVLAGCAYLESQGFSIKFAGNYLARDTIRAGTISERLADVNELLDRGDVQALFATWGGKSCNHLVPHLPYEKFRTARKALLGFSDIAVLLNAVTAKTGLVTFHGPNIVGKLDESSWSSLESLRATFPWAEVNLVEPAKKKDGLVLRGGTAQGRLFGGNLNCFVLGVVMSRLDLGFFDGGIFFWEDIGLTPRQIDQFLTALINVGFMERISGMVVGDFFASEPQDWLKSDPLESVLNALRDFTFPILYAPIFGHRKLENPVFPIGPRATLDTHEFSLRIVDQVVST